MATYLAPPFGTTGLYELKAPFAAKIVADQEYTCTAIRSFGDLVAEGKSVYAHIYEPIGLTEADFLRDSKDEVQIVSLRSASGGVVRVPTSYIISFPTQGGFAYEPLAIGVFLGAIPQIMPLDNVRTAIRNVVKDSLGIDPEIRTVRVGNVSYKATEEHERLEAARLDKVTYDKSDYGMLLEYKKQNELLQDKIASLEAWIVANS